NSSTGSSNSSSSSSSSRSSSNSSRSSSNSSSNSSSSSSRTRSNSSTGSSSSSSSNSNSNSSSSSSRTRRDLPGHDDEEVQPVPGVAEVTALAEDPQGHHLHHHLQREEDVDERIEGLQQHWRSTLAFDAFIYIFFALEMVVKMVALGIFGQRCYLGDTWNRLDFFIVMAGSMMSRGETGENRSKIDGRVGEAEEGVEEGNTLALTSQIVSG
ncbi:hypothetical protein CRUP_001577, partial [Coryphaenoides rupestris]